MAVPLGTTRGASSTTSVLVRLCSVAPNDPKRERRTRANFLNPDAGQAGQAEMGAPPVPPITMSVDLIIQTGKVLVGNLGDHRPRWLFTPLRVYVGSPTTWSLIGPCCSVEPRPAALVHEDTTKITKNPKQPGEMRLSSAADRCLNIWSGTGEHGLLNELKSGQASCSTTPSTCPKSKPSHK
jgi:hypothetical protein